MNAKTSVSVISVEAIKYMLLFNLHDCTFNYCILRIMFLYILFNGVCVKKVLLISIPIEWNIRSPVE